MYQQH